MSHSDLMDCKFYGSDVNKNMFKAIFSSDLEEIDRLIDSFGLNYSPFWDDGYNLLQKAVECGCLDAAKLLVKKGCKIDNISEMFDTLIKRADEELINIILEENPRAFTGLYNGQSFLHMAIDQNRRDLVQFLLARIGKIDIRNKGGKTPLHLSVFKGEQDISMLVLLLQDKANTESEDDDGNTSLFLAASLGNKTAVKTLLKYGANCNCRNKSGLTPLSVAVSRGHFDIVTDLIAAGADVNAQNELGQTPLHIACLQKDSNLISLLLNAGADINVEDSKKMIPFDALMLRNSLSLLFQNCSSSSFIVAKPLITLKIGGFELHRRNQVYFDSIYESYCSYLYAHIGNPQPGQETNMFLSIIEHCKEEIELMKNLKSSRGGFSVYDIFKKMKNPLSITTEHEIEFLQSITLDQTLPLYAFLIKSHLKNARIRNELVDKAQECFFDFMAHSVYNLPVLPEEVRIHVVSFLDNSELKRFTQCCKYSNTN